MKKIKCKRLLQLLVMSLLVALPCSFVLAHKRYDLIAPTHFVAKLLHGICLGTGIGLIISGIVKYNEYRKHKDARLSVIFFLILTGGALIGIGLLPIPNAK